MIKPLKYFLIAGLILPLLAGAALEIDFPQISGVKPTDNFGPANWVNYLFVFGIAVVGLAILGTVIYAGVLYLTAGDNSGKVTEAKDRLWGALIGFVILMGSYIILRTINPQLVDIKNPQIDFYIESRWRDYYRTQAPRLKANGDTCEEDKECASGICRGGRCVAPQRPTPTPQPSETLPANPATPVNTEMKPKGIAPPQQ
ncbi:MAG: pilin [Patescibacteria group bacterium]